MMQRPIAVLAAAIIAAPLFVSTAFAQTGKKGSAIEEMTVTATKRKEDIQQVPLAVTAFSGAALEKLNATNLMDVAKFIPGLQILQSNINRNTTVSIRGVGSSGTNSGIEPSVGLFLDGVFIPAAGPIQGNLLDIAAVEVLRGPQGTLYGRNTSVGAINITTREPSSETNGLIKVGLGNRETQSVSGYFGGAITDEISGRLTLWEAAHGGYQDNRYTGKPANDNAQYGFRSRFKWTPSENFTNGFIGYFSHMFARCCIPDNINPTGVGGIASAGYLAAAAANGTPFVKFTSLDNAIYANSLGSNHTDVYGVSNQADWNIGDYTVTSITAFNTYIDNLPNTTSSNTLQVPFGNIQTNTVRAYSEELRVASPKGRMIDFLAGLYLFRESVAYTQQLTPTQFANRVTAVGRFRTTDSYNFLFKQATNSQAIFGQATWNATRDLRFIGGMRYSWEDKLAATHTILAPGSSAAFIAQNPANPLGTILTQDGTKLTWMGTAQYDIADRVMAYATIATGYKSGGFNARVSPPGTPLSFGPENSLNYEVGAKTSFFDRSLVFNVDFYRMIEKGYQQSLLNPVTGTGFIVGNIGNSRSDGIEFDAQWRPMQQLLINASGAFTDVEIYNYSAGQCASYPGTVINGSRPGTCNYNGRRPTGNPSVTYTLGAEWRQPVTGALDGFVGINGNYTGQQYLDATLDPRSLQKPYALISARLGVEAQDGRWSLTAYGKNLTGEIYYVASAALAGAAYMSAGGTTAPTGFIGWYGAPRIYGVEATYRY